MKPQLFITPNQRAIDGDIESKMYDTATEYDKAIFYSGAYSLTGIPISAIINQQDAPISAIIYQQDAPSVNIEL